MNRRLDAHPVRVVSLWPTKMTPVMEPGYDLAEAETELFWTPCPTTIASINC